MNSKWFWLLFCIFSSCCFAENSQIEVIPLSNRPAAELIPLLIPLLQDSDRVVDNGSSLIVKTTPSRLQNIQQLIRKLDVKLSNLLVTVIQNTNKTADELNTVGYLSAAPQEINMQGMHGDTRDVIISQGTQLLRTLDGQPAVIKTGQIKPIQNINIYGNYNGNSVAGMHTQMQEISSGFAVTPRLSGQQVLLDITPWSENFQQNGRIQTQAAHSSLRANLGEWVEIGGVDSSTQSSNGFNGLNHSTVANNLRILIKVDLAD